MLSKGRDVEKKKDTLDVSGGRVKSISGYISSLYCVTMYIKHIHDVIYFHLTCQDFN